MKFELSINVFAEDPEKGTTLYLEKMWREGYDPDRMGQPLYAIKFGANKHGNSYKSDLDQPQVFFMWKYFPDDVLTHIDTSVGGRANGTIYTYFNTWWPYHIVASQGELPDYVRGKGYDYKPEAIDTGDLWFSAVKANDPDSISLKIQVPNGKVQFYTDVLDLIAPEEGYTDSAQIKLKVGDFSSQAFIFTRKKVSDDEYKYSRYDLRGIEADYSDNNEDVKFRFHLYQYGNPYGSRNLEHNRNNGFTAKELGEMREFREKITEIERTQGDKAADEYWIRASKEIFERREREKVERTEHSKQILPKVLELEKKRLAFKPILEAILAGKPLPPDYTPGGPIPGYKPQAQSPSKLTLQKDQPLSVPEEEKIQKTARPLWIFFGILGFVLMLVVFILAGRRKKQS